MDLFNNRQRYYFIMRIECIFIVLFFFNTLSPNTDHYSHQHRAICKSPLPQNTTTLIPISAISPHSSLFTAHRSLTSVHSSLFILHSSFFILHSSFFTLHSSLFTLHSSLFILHSSLFTLHSSLFTLHSSFFILHSSFFILHSSFFTLHSSFFTLHSTNGYRYHFVLVCLIQPLKNSQYLALP